MANMYLITIVHTPSVFISWGRLDVTYMFNNNVLSIIILFYSFSHWVLGSNSYLLSL